MPKEQNTCPKCAAKVGPWDTRCLECGAPLIPERKERPEEDTDRGRATRVAAAAGNSATGAQAGQAEAGEDWKKSRMKVYDKHLAEELKKARPAIIITAVLSLVAGVLLTGLAWNILQGIGGFSAIKSLDFERIQSLRFLAILDETVLFFVTAGLAIASFLGSIGEFIRFRVAGINIALIEDEEPPEIMGVHPASQVALLISSIFCPPLGLLLGIILRFNRGEELRSLGAQMIQFSLIVVALFLGSVIWDVAADAVQSADVNSAANSATSQTQ